MVTSVLDDDFVQSYASVWQAHTKPHFYPHSYVSSYLDHVCICHINTSYWFINQIWMLRVGTEVTMICLLQNILKAKLTFIHISRRSKLNLSWCEFLFFTVWCFHWFVKKRNNLPGPLSSSGLNTHLDCFYPNRCRTMQQRSDAAFAAMIHCCSQAERRWQWVRALFLLLSS